MMIPKWIITNLKQYHNCLIPNLIIKKYGIEKIEMQFQEEHKMNVHINCVKYVESNSAKRGRKKVNVTYIAEVLK